MWHWQHKNEHTKIVLLAKLAGISLTAHLVFLGYLLLWYHDQETYRISLSTSRITRDTPVVFMPLYKRMQPSLQTALAASSTTAKKTAIKHAAAAGSTQKAPLTRALKNSTTLAPSVPDKKHESKKIASLKKADSKKSAKQSTITNTATARIKEKTTLNKNIASPIKQLPKKEAQTSTAKAPTPAQTAKQEDIQKQSTSVPEASASVSSATDAASEQELASEQEPIYVGRDEWYALQLQSAIEDEIAQHWQVPGGLPSHVTCQIAVTVDWQGAIQSARIAQSSGVLAYDISARSAASHMQLPAIAHGKEFIITFKQ